MNTVLIILVAIAVVVWIADGIHIIRNWGKNVKSMSMIDYIILLFVTTSVIILVILVGSLLLFGPL